jgi:hypothetical protein
MWKLNNTENGARDLCLRMPRALHLKLPRSPFGHKLRHSTDFERPSGRRQLSSPAIESRNFCCRQFVAAASGKGRGEFPNRV